MTKDKVLSLIALAKANHSEAEALAKDEREKAAAELYATLGDMAKPYIDKLFEEIEEGSALGIINYEITNLPQEDFSNNIFKDICSTSFPGPNVKVKQNTVTARVVDILKEYGILTEVTQDKNLFFLRVKL